MAAARTCPARVLWWQCHQPAALPCKLVVQLAAELEQTLVEDGLVQARLGPNVLVRLVGAACRRPGHVPYLQVLDTHHRVVLADRGRGLMQEVAPGVADLLVQLCDFGFGLLPVVAEFGLAAHGKQLVQPGVAELFLPLLVAFLLQRQRLVKHEPARPGA